MRALWMVSRWLRRGGEFQRVLAIGLLVASWGASAEAPADPLTWLGRIAMAGQRLNYAGTFTYQNGKVSETSRIVHLRDATGEYERLEALDGSPREVIRTNGEVRCVLPAQKTVIIDQAGGRRAFPSRLAEAWMNLSESYRIRRGEVSRVAGLEAQEIILEPKDDLRYGYLLWADTNTGLLLKSRMVNERGETVEQFAFNEVKIGGTVERAQLQSRFAGDQSTGWQVVNAGGNALRPEDTGWSIKATVPGFYQTSAVRRQMGPAGADTVQLVFSDGLAAVSLFIEPGSGVAEGKVTPGPAQSGPINLYKRVVGNYLVTALGEVPSRTVQRLAEAVEPAKR